MPVLAIKNEQRCKLCKTPHRPLLDALLEMRSNGENDEAGQRVNFDYVAARYAELHTDAAKPADRKLTEENVKGHWKNHCQKVAPEEAGKLAEVEAKVDEAKAAVFERVLGEGWEERDKSPDEYLAVLRELAFVELYEKVKAGAPLGLTIDHALKGVDSSTRRKQEETTAAVLRQLGAGIAGGLLQRREQEQLPPPEEVVVEEAEVVEA